LADFGGRDTALEYLPQVCLVSLEATKLASRFRIINSEQSLLTSAEVEDFRMT
jgi:hypothetical protein